MNIHCHDLLSKGIDAHFTTWNYQIFSKTGLLSIATPGTEYVVGGENEVKTDF